MLPDPLSRRTLLHAGAATAGLAALASVRIHAAARTTLGPTIIGSGEHTYECLHDWAQVPSDIAFGNTHGVGVDAAGNVYIKHTVHASSSSADALCIFDPAGKFVRSWGAEYRGGAHGLTIARDSGGEFLFLADCQSGVVRKTSLTGERVLDLAWPEESGLYGSKGEYKPTNVAVVPPLPAPSTPSAPSAAKPVTPHALWTKFTGHIFVADGYGKNWIHHYSPKGEYLGSFGGPGKERGQVSCPHGIMIDTRGPEPLIVVADRSNRRLQLFSLDGRHRGFVSSELRSPCHFDQRGSLLLVPDLDARVTLLDAENKPVIHLGDGTNFALRDKPRGQFIPGKFIAPHSACFDAQGNIFVVEWVEVGRVTKLRKIS